MLPFRNYFEIWKYNYIESNYMFMAPNLYSFEIAIAWRNQL
jgi:hypothetical protein